MTKTRRYLSGTLGAFLLCQSSLCLGSERPQWYFQLDASGQTSFWRPGLKTEGEPLVQYKTEGLTSYEARALLGYGGPIAFLSYETPFNAASGRQRDMFVSNKLGPAGVEKYVAGIGVQPILFLAFPSLSEHHLLRLASSFEFSHSETIFYGNAQAARSFMFLPSDARVDWSHLTVYGARKLSAGSSLAFRTQFVDNEMTVSLWDFKGYSLRVGYYDLAWQRPSDNNDQYMITDGVSVYPILYETTYRTRGITFLYKNNASAAPRWNIDVGFRHGFDNKIKAALERQLGEKESLEFNGVRLGLWYNWYPSRKARGLSWSVGFAMDYRKWEIETRDSNNKVISTKRIDEEMLNRFFAGVRWRL